MKYKILFLVLGILAILLIVSVALAAGDTSYDIPWWTVDSGGGDSTSLSYSLSGTIGQPDASQTLAGGSYTLVGGFWSGPGEAVHKVYLPLVLR